MSPSRHAVVFDWNGTLLADTALCVQATNKVLERFGLPHITIARYRAEYTVPLHLMYRAFGCTEEMVIDRQQELIDIFRGHYEPRAHKLRPRRGASKALAALKARGHSTAILSNYTKDSITAQVARLGLSAHFDALLTSDSITQVFMRGGKGERLKAFVEVQNTKKAIIVGDTVEEVQIARDYGYVAVALADGVCSASRLKAAKPDFLITSLEALPDIAQKVFGAAA